MCGSHPPASLPPTKFRPDPSDATSYSPAPAPRAPRSAGRLRSTWRPDPAQEPVVLHRAPANGGCLQWPYTIGIIPVAGLSLSLRDFSSAKLVCLAPLSPPRFSREQLPIAGLPPSLPSSLSAFASRFVTYQLQRLLEVLQHCISCPSPFFPPHASYLKCKLFVLFQEI